MGTGASDTTQLDFKFSGTYSRFYEVKVTQLPCSNEYKLVFSRKIRRVLILNPDLIATLQFFSRYPGCFQFHTGLTGRVKTFNFANCPSQSHLPNQE